MQSSAHWSAAVALALFAVASLACPPGWFDAGGACVMCAAGRYSDGGVVCHDCDQGRYAPAPGTTVCFSCPPGRHSVGNRSTGCQACEAGFYQDEPSKTICKECGAGRAARYAGMVECSLCPAGSRSARRASSCIACDPLEWSAEGQENCRPCPDKIDTTTPVAERICALNAPSEYQLEENYSRVSNETTRAHVCSAVMSSDNAAIGTCVVVVVVLLVYIARVLWFRS